MSSAEGLRIISVAKSLESFQRGDQNISSYFGATLLAGHAGLFLSSLRGHQRMTWKKFRVLAGNAHIDSPLLRITIWPWLKAGAFVEGTLTADSSEILCNVLDHEAILAATSKLFRSLDPTPEEIAVLGIVDLGSQFPQLRSEILSSQSLGTEEVLERATGLAKAYKIVNVLDGPGVAEPVVYSALIWGDKIAQAGKALSHLKPDRRDALLRLVDLVREYQGLPLASAENWARQQGHPEVVAFAIGIGILDKTQIDAPGGGRKEFLTTPHIYGELAATQGKDVCDRVRLFLDSIRHGQHYGDWYTGRILDPSVLLTKLIDTGEIGPCSAIGTDYQLVEKAGVVNVKPSKYRQGQFTMELVQEDTVRLVRDIVARRFPTALTGPSTPRVACNQSGFVSAEATRATLGEQPQRVREAEQEMLRNLREM